LLLFSSFKLAEQAPAGVCVDKKKVYKGSDRHDHMVFLLHFVHVELRSWYHESAFRIAFLFDILA
jgi:hypothetical protein